MSSDRANLKQWVLAEADGEPIEAVVIGECQGCYGEAEYWPVPRYAEQPKGKVLMWSEAAPWLDYEFDSGFGSANCNAIYAWTAFKVITISEYDGATYCESTPRHPMPCKPEYR